MGGTRFLGRHITEAVLSAGHDVTLVHRGRSGAHLFPEATHLMLDRDGDLSPLRGTRWDTVIDVNAYLPHQVVSLAEALHGGVGRYVLISTVSVYQPPRRPGYDETHPVRTLPPGTAPRTVTMGNYGALKALCESAAVDSFGPGTLTVRPSYVIGPFDHFGRFAHWIRRLVRGGEVLAPGFPDRAIQLIDARDVAGFTLTPACGTFHLAGPQRTFGQLLEEIATEVAPPGTRLTWVDPQFLLDAGENGETIPLWYAGDDGDALLNTADTTAAVTAGLRVRPLVDTIRDVRGEATATRYLPADREADLLARWNAEPGPPSAQPETPRMRG